MKNSEQKKNWSLSSNAFGLFLAWLDENEDSEGRKYLEMRQRLIAYFDRKNCLNPDEMADETLNRVARTLEEKGSIDTEAPAKYCYITARFVFLESLRSKETKNIPLDDFLNKPQNSKRIVTEPNDEKETKEKMLDCLEECANKLDGVNREMILGYYIGEERIKINNRRAMAEKIGISVNALSIRACRIRDKLEICVNKCAGK